MLVTPVQFIADINPKKDFWKLAVRVKDKWVVVKDGKEHLEMVIVDSKGDDIHVVIPTEYKAIFDIILQEDNTYTLSNFQVGKNDLLFKASDHKYRLKWTGGTTAVDVNVHNIPHPILKMKPLAEIISGKWRSDMLYRELCYWCGSRYGILPSSRYDITLNCTLWESYAGTFIRYNNERKEQGPVIVLLKYGKVKEEGLCFFMYRRVHVLICYSSHFPKL
ncbi:putative nucleic acid-binding protein [Medicago truncatula]|uniref:Putative nucleic acid-binding protein n=1 Tax=Medicago truncatula TaxID=3880 RepID=A0A396HQQ9_MEDTR|nr:putative nucleic acid-binding protein [Medicago truncatula]